MLSAWFFFPASCPLEIPLPPYKGHVYLISSNAVAKTRKQPGKHFPKLYCFSSFLSDTLPISANAFVIFVITRTPNSSYLGTGDGWNQLYWGFGEHLELFFKSCLGFKENQNIFSYFTKNFISTSILKWCLF